MNDPTVEHTERPLTIAVLAGDGIGPEIVPAAVAGAKAALAAAGAPPADWPALPMGLSAIDSHGSALPDDTIDALGSVDGWLLGPHDSAGYPPPHDATLNPSGVLRKRFDLYANIRPARAYPAIPAMAPETDLVIVRENTQGFYADRNTHLGTGEFMPTPDVAMAMAIITRPAVERIARVALELAMTRRKRLTVVHKANVLRLTTGMFRDICYELAADYPEVTVDDHHVDAMTVHLVRRSADFDVIVAENMMGDILSDLTGELAGSLGIAPSINRSDHFAMAQAAHGSAPDIAGRGVANPIAMVLSTAMLLDRIAEVRADASIAAGADLLRLAVEATVADGTVTPDLGGRAGTEEVAASIIDAVGR